LRVLFLLQEFPYPPDNGIRWKPFTLLQGLSGRHQCDLLCFGNAAETAQIEGLISRCPGVSVLGVFPRCEWGIRSQLRGYIKSGLPSSGVYASEVFRNAVRNAMGTTHYDLVHIDMINLAQHADLVGEVPLVISSNDAVSMGYQNRIGDVRGMARLRNAVAWRLIRRYEQRAFRHRTIHVVSEVDRRYLERLVPTASIELIKLPVESAYMADTDGTKSPEEATVAIPANFGAPGLADRIVEILEFMSRETQFFASTKFHLIGKPGPRTFTKKLEHWVNVEQGWVDDFGAALRSARIVMFPEVGGGGTKNRVLQSMALGKPVVLSPSAAAGVDGRNGNEFLVCSTPAEFASGLQRLIQDQQLALSIGSAARRIIRRERSLETIAQQWEALYQRVIRSQKCGSYPATARGPRSDLSGAKLQ
jgi:glycosyltransferase involved in cell wall biosynthesis